jgi:hypothetical protein
VSDAPFKLLATPFIRIGGSGQSPGGWLSNGPRPVQSARERLGYGRSTTSDFQNSTSFYYSNRNLMPEQLWKLYRTTPDVRACVDSITRRIATWNWSIKPKIDPRNKEEYDRLADRCSEAMRWLSQPNMNGETWQEIQTRTLIDLLVYDAGVQELNENDGNLVELVPWLGSEWFPLYNEKNVLLGYVQEKEDAVGYPTDDKAKKVTLPPEKLVYYSLFRNNREVLGVPLLDTIVNECITVLLASEHAMLALDADEIPPGLLVLGGVAGAAAERARADLQQMRGKDHKVRVISSAQPGGIKAEWVELRHTLKDIELIDVVDAMRRTIWRVFGVMPVELGVGDSTPRALAEVQVDVSSSHLITPILELMQARINAQVIPLLLEDDAEKCVFMFDREQPLTPQQRLDLARAQDVQVRRGIITVNEARATLGLLPVDGGDVPVMDTNEGPRPLTVVTAGTVVEPDSPEEDAPFDPNFDDAAGSETERALSDLSKATQDLLKDKAKKHNEEVKKKGKSEWRKTNARTLAVVYDRGIGAYNTNPESVRPVVTSAHQWAVARVNGWLYALMNDKFKRGKFDTDLLPKQHPHSTKGKKERAVVSKPPSLPTAPVDTAWGWEAGEQDKVLGDPPSWGRYKRAHLWNDPSKKESKAGYKFPVARIVDGELKLVFRGAAAVVGSLKRDGKHESLNGVSIDDQVAIYRRVQSIYERFGKEAPVIDRLERSERGPACRQPGESKNECVSRKIPELVSEGYEQKQAVAIANSMCEQSCSEERVAARYSHINFKPPKGVVDELKKGLEWNKQGHGGKGLVPATVAWARRMANGADISPEKARKMRAWLARHEVDKKGKGFRPGEEGYPSPGRVAWALWGGDPAKPWSAKIVNQVDAADKKAGIKRGKHPEGTEPCGHSHSASARSNDWLPSSWPSPSMFNGYRTISVASVADIVEQYTREVSDLYDRANIELQSILIRAYDRDGELSPQNAQMAQIEMLDRLDQLAYDWSLVTRPMYQKAARVGLNGAEEISDQPVEQMWRLVGDNYHGQAMAYLTDEQGLIGTLKQKVRSIVSASSMYTRDRIEDIDENDGALIVVGVLAATMQAQKHRVDNWSGKINALANIALVSSLLSTTSTETVITDAGFEVERPVEWMVEWVSFSGRNCPVCAEEGAQPIRPLSELSRRPGEDTVCGARCRCVLVFWTRNEVNAGRSFRLSSGAPGGPDA